MGQSDALFDLVRRDLFWRLGDDLSLPKGQYLLQASRLPVTTDLTAVTAAVQTQSDNLRKDQATLTTANAKLTADKADKKATPSQRQDDQAAVDAANAQVGMDKALLALVRPTSTRRRPLVS